ncbi:zinc finger BED domain-containing protein 1-like, partial [Silurus meridionalis]
ELHPPTQNVTSSVWEHFGYLKDAEGTVVCDGFPICKICHQKVPSKGGNTTNMFKHLKDSHRSVYSEIRVCTRHSKITRFDPLRTENEQESVELHLPTTDALSPVWKYFGYPKNADGSLVSDGFPLCRLCRLKVVAKGGSTTNMLVHLRAYHLEVYEEVKEAITTLRTAWGIEPPELHPPTQNVTSAVWQYFGYLKDAGGSVVCDDFPICKLCQQKVASKRRCTTNMFKHLKDYHRSVYDEVR